MIDQIYRELVLLIKYTGRWCDWSYIPEAGVIYHLYGELVWLIIYTESWRDLSYIPEAGEIDHIYWELATLMIEVWLIIYIYIDQI